jgi:hypothetical protein
MGGDNVELLWYGLCVIKAVVTLFVVSVVGLLCKQFLRCIPRDRERHIQSCESLRTGGDASLGSAGRNMNGHSLSLCYRRGDPQSREQM